MRNVTRAVLLLSLVVVLSACALPVHVIQPVEIQGVMEHKGEEEPTDLPTVHVSQLRTWDADEAREFLRNPDAYPHMEFRKTPGADGRFTITHDYLTAAVSWVIPPLGITGEPGLPPYVFRFSDHETEAHVLTFSDRTPSVTVYNSVTGNPIKKKAHRTINVKFVNVKKKNADQPSVYQIGLSIQ